MSSGLRIVVALVVAVCLVAALGATPANAGTSTNHQDRAFNEQLAAINKQVTTLKCQMASVLARLIALESRATPAAGPQGPKGDTGPAGSAGATGPAGPQGPAGAVGAHGEIGPAGSQGATGPAGPKGDTGETGPAGPTGPSADAGFWPVDDVETTVVVIAMHTLKGDDWLLDIGVGHYVVGPVMVGVDEDYSQGVAPQILAKISVGGKTYLTNGELKFETTGSPRIAEGALITVEYWWEGYGIRKHATATFSGWTYDRATG